MKTNQIRSYSDTLTMLLNDYMHGLNFNRYNVYVPKHVDKVDFIVNATREIEVLCNKAYKHMLETGEQLQYELPYALHPDAEDPVMEAMRDAYTSMEYYENALAGMYD